MTDTNRKGMKTQTVYFAHPKGYYGSPREKEALAFLEKTFKRVINPGTEDFQKAARMVREAVALKYWPGKGWQAAMNVFLNTVANCDVCVFFTYEDGALGAGTAKELRHMLHNADKPVFRLEKDKLIPFTKKDLQNSLILSIPNTAARNKDIENVRSQKGAWFNNPQNDPKPPGPG